MECENNAHASIKMQLRDVLLCAILVEDLKEKLHKKVQIITNKKTA